MLEDGYLHEWYSLQADLLQSISESFLEIEPFQIPLLDLEPIGATALSQLSVQIFGNKQPDAMLSPIQSVSFEQVDGRYQLRFWLPQLDRADLEIGTKDRELILSAGGYTRVFSLPDAVLDRQIEEANFREGTLQVCFRSRAAP